MDIKEALRKRKAFETNVITKAMEDPEFKKALLKDPKDVIGKEGGQPLPEGMTVKIIEEEPNVFYIVLPHKYEAPKVDDELTDEALENVAGGGNVGVAVGIVDTTGVAVTALF